MTSELDSLTSLSRSSDHLGNLANVLKDLGGGATLLHELTQNANDAKADRIRFTASTDELTVWNSALFSDCGRQDLRQCPWKIENGQRSCDLHSFRQVAGRHKANDDTTTGAFGVGFTAVYQVTDHPELVSGGRHLVLDESRAEEERIQICTGNCGRDHTSPGTTFYLPWAREHTVLRRELGMSPLDDGDIVELTDQLHDAAGSTLVFLEHVTCLDVVTPSKCTTAKRERTEDRVTLSLDGDLSEWLFLEGTAEGAETLKANYDLGGSRSALVQVAIPLNEAIVGRIYADLPTETPSGWSGHINATFFPRQDRKTVEFDGSGFRGKWNDLLVDTAARVVASRLETIASKLGHRVAWSYLVDAEQINRGIAKAEHPKAFGAFFARAKASVPALPIALLADGRSVVPAGSIVPRDEAEYEAVDVLLRLGLPIIDRSIRTQLLQVSRTEYGVRQLSAADVVNAIRDAGLTESWWPTEETVLDRSDVELILQLLNHLQDRGKTTLLDAEADSVAIVPCLDGSLAPANTVLRFGDDDRALFELLAPDLKTLDETKLAVMCPALVDLCADITPAQAVEIFDRDHDALAAGPLEVLDWLENHRAALHDRSVQSRVRALPVFPSTTGGFKPLAELSLASNFEDVLGVADVVDRRRASGHEDLLRLLGAQELDAIEYLTRHVIPRAQAGDLGGALVRRILEIVYDARPGLEANDAVRHLLSVAPLVCCTDGLTRPAVAVHSPNPALALISPDEPIADTTGLASHLVETLWWMGVSRSPSDRVLVSAAARLASNDVDPPHDVVLAILDALPEQLPQPIPTTLSSLVMEAWLPVEGGGRAAPPEVYAVFQREIFESQGPKLGLPRIDQNSRARKLAWLGVQPAPTTSMVIAHLRHCVRTGQPLKEQVYRTLGEAQETDLVSGLRGSPCVQVRPGEFVEPEFVFWTDPGLGRWAHQLPHGYRQFQQFFDVVGVREAPSPPQIAGILRKMSRSLGNDPLDLDDRTVIHRCWELLDQQLMNEASHSGVTEVLTQLRSIRSALDDRGMLEKPEMLLFVDGRRLAEKIALISNNLIRRDRATQRALNTAGTRAAEDLIDTLVDPNISFTRAGELKDLVVERTPAIRRLVEPYRDEELMYDLSRLASVEFLTVPDLVLKYKVRFAHQVQITDPEPADAVFLEDKDQLLVRSQAPSRHLAREVARCIEPSADVSVIAPSLHEILSARTLDEAMEVLNEYGVRDLDEAAWAHVATQVSDAGEDAETPGAMRHAGLSDEAHPAGSTMDPDDNDDVDGSPDGPAAPHGDSRRSPLPGHEPAAKRPAERRTQMASFVSFGGDEDRDSNEAGDEAAERSQVDAAGVRRVLQYEASCGRVPREQAHSNPGFDVLSFDARGQVLRRIEVKSIGGAWTGFGVWMSATQMEENRAHEDDFWLYVVEHAKDDDAAVIHRLHNPAGSATKFGFDAGWQALREPDQS